MGCPHLRFPIIPRLEMRHPFYCLIALIVSANFGFAEEPLTFEKHVRPILKAHCFHCHGESGVKEASLDVRLRRFIANGSDSGDVLSPGEPDGSLLLERIESGEMPPEGERLPDADLKTIRRWIAGGAKTARPEPESLDSGDYFTEEERSFWSFRPIQRPIPPSFPGETANPIDAFVLKRLKDVGLNFSTRADRHTLIRRATFDLWGLPPTPEMVERFIKDDDPNAYERLIDRLLASPRYGERWGRHWLDVAGYADSEGYTDEDKPREFAYFYRDYVIDSFNEDKPLDQFVCEQLAGDEMASKAVDPYELTSERRVQFAATGFMRLAPDGTASGGVDRLTAANQNVADTIEIVSSAFLGLTVGCARCHDHRYDPISQADYYRFRALLTPALNPNDWRTPSQRRISLYTDEQRAERKRIEESANEQSAKRTKRQQEHIERTLEEELLVVPDDIRETLRVAYKTAKEKRTSEQTALLEEHPSVGNISPGSLYLYAEQRARRAGDIEKEAAKRLAKYIDEAKSRHPDVEVTEDKLKELMPDAYAEIQRYRRSAETCRKLDAKKELADMQAEYNRIRATAPKEYFLRFLHEPVDYNPPTHLFIRGDHNQPGEKMTPAELTVLRRDDNNIAENDPNCRTSGRRLAYAKNLTSGKHPLLPRVLVNRVWMHHFGRGIVATPSDFGLLGDRPTHPQLLDWLADELMRGGWNLKRIHRLMMLSRTYQQNSDRTEKLDEVDPDNKLLARMSIRRLESEAIRDTILSVSGSLLDEIHGPPVPVKEDAVGRIVLGVEMLDGERKPTGKDADFPGKSRRSLYIQIRRSRPLSVLQPFDLPIMTPNCARRRDSNVATQTLLMMNNDFVIDQSRKMADALIQSAANTEARLSAAWRRCFARPIDNSALEEMKRFVESQKQAFLSRQSKRNDEAAYRDSLASAVQAMISSNEFIYID